MSIEVSISHVNWKEFCEAVAEGTVADPFWENDFAIDDEEADFLCDHELHLLLSTSESYTQIRVNLPVKQREVLDQIVGGLMWNCDYRIPTDPPFTARTNVCDVDSYRGEAQTLLSPESVKAFLALYEQIDWELLSQVANETLDAEALDVFKAPDELVEYIAEWRRSLERATEGQYGLYAYVAI